MLGCDECDLGVFLVWCLYLVKVCAVLLLLFGRFERCFVDYGGVRFVFMHCSVVVPGLVLMCVVYLMLLKVVCFLGLGVCFYIVSLCSGCDGCCAFCLICDAFSSRCAWSGSILFRRVGVAVLNSSLCEKTPALKLEDII